MCNQISWHFVLALGLLASAQAQTGWRGDGTGQYSDAHPPLTWSRTIQTGHRAFLARTSAPGERAEGDPLAQVYAGRGAGHFSPVRWLMHGSFNIPKEVGGHGLEYKAVEDEGTLGPERGAWREIAGGDMNLSEELGSYSTRQMVYLFAWLYLPEDSTTGFRGDGPEWQHYFHLWIDGKSVSGWEGHRHELSAGWHRILVKITSPAPPAKWNCRLSFFPFGEDIRYAEKNMAWTTRMPDEGYGMPILAGDALFCLSEPDDLVCLDKQSGAIRWKHSNSIWETLSAEEQKQISDAQPLAEQMEMMNDQAMTPEGQAKRRERKKRAEDLRKAIRKARPEYKVHVGWGGGNCGTTPVCDGESIYAWFGETGVLAKYDLVGQRQWVRFHPPGNGGEHGINSSPVLVGDRLLVIGGKCLIAFNAGDGSEAWRTPYRPPSYCTLIAGRAGDVDVVIAGNGQVFRVDNGKAISEAIGRHDGECASPVLEGDRFYLVSRGGFAAAQLIPGPAVTLLYNIEPKLIDSVCEVYPVGSPVIDRGIFYFVRSGWGFGPHVAKLYALDAASGNLIYRQELDFDSGIFYNPKGAGVAASLCLAGERLYITDNRGTTIVCAPGNIFRQLAHNQVEHLYTAENVQEVTNSTAIYEGTRRYIRGQENFYCMEAVGE